MKKINDIKRKASVVCPGCLEDFETEIYRVVNIPFELEKKFEPMKLNIVKCPFCDKTFQVGERVLIVDNESEIVFIVFPDSDEDDRFTRSVFREVKLILKDLALDSYEFILIVGIEKFYYIIKLRENKAMLESISAKLITIDKKSLFYRKLEIIAEVILESGLSVDDFNSEENIMKLKERLGNIVGF